MGKVSKRRRTTLRYELLQTLEKNAELTQSAAAYQHAMESYRRQADTLRAQLDDIIKAIQRIDPRCAVLPVNERDPIPAYFNRVPIQERNGVMRIYDEAADCSPIAVQRLIHLLLYDRTIGNELRKTLHFRVKNAAEKSDFTIGYAISEHKLRSCRYPEDSTRMICREFGAAIHATLFPKKNSVSTSEQPTQR